MWGVADELAQWRADGRRAAVARAVSSSGFGGRRADEVLAVAAGAGSRQVGSLLGGSADALVAGAVERLGPESSAEVLDVTIGDPEAIAAGLACGGVARVLVQDVAALPSLFWESLAGRRPVALATVLPGGAGAGTGVLAVGAGGALDGVLEPPALHSAAVETAGRLLASRREPSTTVEVESVTVLVEAFVPATRLVILSEPVGLVGALERQAGLLGWEVVVVAGAGEGMAAVAGLGPQDALVVLTHDHDLATPVLAAAVAGEAYVGALGSRHTQQVRRERLEAAGAGPDQQARVHGPVGLDLGARAPEETALAICAEILAVRSGRGAASLTTTTGPING